MQASQLASDRDDTREQPRRTASWSKRGDGTGVVFPVVGLGVPLGFVHSWTSTTCDPLTAPGEVRTIRLGHRPGWPIVAGRLLDAAGGPLAHVEFGVYMRLGALHHHMPQGFTHADGTFAVALANPDDVRREITELRLGIQDRMAYPPVRGPLEARVYDLGDVVLRPAPFIVGGRVVLPASADSSLGSMSVERLEHVKYLDGSEQDLWRRVDRAVLRRDGDAFSFAGVIEDGRLRVTASGLLPPPPVEFRLGASDLLLQFRAASALSVQFAGELPVRSLRVWLEPAPGVVPALRSSNLDASTGPSGWYSFPSLWPGRYRLLAQVLGDATPTLVVDGVDVAEGQTKALGPLALPAPIRKLTIRIQDETGKPLRLSALVVHPARGEQATVLLAPEGEVSVPTTAASVEVVATAAGRRAVRLQLDADTTVRLAPATTRTVTVDGGIPALPQDVEFALEVHAEGAAASLREQRDSRSAACVGLQSRRKLALDAAGRGSVELAQAGRYRVVPVLLTLKTRFSYRVEIEGAAVELVIGERDLDATAAIAVTLPEAGLRKAKARLGELLTR